MVIGPSQDADHRKVTLPERWQVLLDGVSGPVTFSRRFNRPTGLGDTDQVSLLLPQCPGQDRRVVLNDTEVAADSSSDNEGRFEVTRYLQISNTLTISFTLPDHEKSSGDNVFEGVVIEIQSAK